MIFSGTTTGQKVKESILTALFLSEQYFPVYEDICGRLSIEDLCMCFSTCRRGAVLKRENKQIQWLIKKRQGYVPECKVYQGYMEIPFHASIFEEACSLGYLQVVQWLLPLCRGVISLHWGVISALKGGQLEIVKFLYKDKGVIRKPNLCAAFKSGNIDCIYWCLGHYKPEQILKYYNISILLSMCLGNKLLYNQILSYASEKDRASILKGVELISLCTRDDGESIERLKSLITHHHDIPHEYVWMHCLSIMIERDMESDLIAFFLKEIAETSKWWFVGCVLSKGSLESLEGAIAHFPLLETFSIGMVWVHYVLL